MRRAARISCAVPLRLRVRGVWRDVLLVDVSRTGVRLRVSLEQLGLDAQTGLGEIATRLGDILPREAPAQFHPDLLGPLVERRLSIVRLVVGCGGVLELELGCRLDEPLTDVEAAALGLTLPAWAPAPSSEAGQDRPRVLVLPHDAGERAPLDAHAVDVDAAGVLLRLRDLTAHDLPTAEGDVRHLAAELEQVYGPTARIEVHHADGTVQTGLARLDRVEVPDDAPGELLVGYAFEDELTTTGVPA